MSGVFKAVGKVFKKVAKVVKKVAIPALMIGAVVLTGGAAIGALPAIGTVLGKLAISGTLASVLGGAISMGAVGAVTGGVMAGIQGKSIWKGAVGGFTTGAIAGGIGGGLGLISPNGILSDMGIGSQAAHIKGLQATGTLSKFMSPAQLAARGYDAAGTKLPAAASSAAAPGSSAPLASAGGQPVAAQGQMAATPSGSSFSAEGIASKFTSIGQPSAAAPPGVGGTYTGPVSSATSAATAPTRASSSGLLSTSNLLQLGGQAISGFAQAKAAAAQSEDDLLASQYQYDRVAMNYGYQNIYETDKKGRTVGGVPIRQERIYEYAPQNLRQPDMGLLRSALSANLNVPYYNIVGGQVVRVG